MAGVTVTGGDATTVVALLNPKSVEIDGEKYFHISVHCDRFKPRSRVPVASGFCYRACGFRVLLPQWVSESF